MRISELSRRSGVPTATIKYYLREGLLPTGERTAATQAQYDDDHLARLRLIRALLGPGRLSIAEIRDVLAAVDDPPESPLDLLGQASEAIGGERPADEADLEPARDLLAELQWSVADDSAALHDLARALAAINQAHLKLIKGGAVAYGKSMHRIAVAEIATVPTDAPDTAVRQAVLGTILIEPLLLSLRRLALQDAAARKFGDH
ncbi:MerR family transcriptional regulator [Microlunatus elymi]|uniref:MerR family transcriptional regulator n=1 Tax=Microlunatus elymi TaxID=2596828 RepID=A0A516PX97_9ACTN|nr:MerR family transcriptional regulator [Microlunatus elymi]QDP95804.1 MerR family transcriptional regulator [Microlunatus elymi]